MSRSSPAARTRSLPRRIAAAGALAWRAHPMAAMGAIAASLILGTAPVATAWLTKLLLDDLAHHGRHRPVTLAVALGGAALVTTVLPSISDYLQGQLRRPLQALIQDRLFRAVNAQPGLARFENPAFHDEVRLARDAGQNAPQRIVVGGLAIGQAALTLGGFIATLIVISPVMVAVILLAALPSVGVQLQLSRQRAHMMWRVSPNTRRQVSYAGLLTSAEAAKEIRLFGLGDFLRLRMLAELRSVNQAERDLALRTMRSQAGLSLLGAVVAALGLVWAILGAASGSLSIGDVSVFIAGVAGVQASLSGVIGQAVEVHNSLAMFGYYLKVLDTGPDLPIPQEPAVLPPLREGIEFRDVWFRYDDEHSWILRGVDLFIPAGRSVALVGLNGAGKSTLVKLLCRMYDPDRGSIHWDGVDLRGVRPEELRDRISAVFQDYMSYDLSAAENIRVGDLAAGDDRERIHSAARLAGIHDTLTGLPRGYDTMLSRMFFGHKDTEAGVVLSGGQRQRLALARALMRERRDLLILDEPSSGLDAESEHAIHRDLRRRREGRTSLLISHRLGAVRDADLIVVLDDGHVSERGTHAELVAASGTYARLYALQACGYAADEAPTAR